MKTNLRVFAVTIFCGIVLSSLCEAKDFNISSLSKRTKEGYCFIYVKYKAKGRKAEDVQLRVYALLGSGKGQSLARINIGGRIERGYTEEIVYVSPGDLKSKGAPKKLRAEVWCKEGGEFVLVCLKTKPKWHKGEEKWWLGDTYQSVVKKGGKDILDLIEKMESED